MIITSALVVRNVYAAYIDPDADEKTYVLAGRVASLFVIIGAAAVSLSLMDVFGQFKIALEVAIIFAAPFWIGMYWRGANRWSAWLTIAFSTLVFFVIPILAPVIASGLRDDARFTITNHVVTNSVTRVATETDRERRDAQIEIWDEAEREFQDAVRQYRLASQAAAAGEGPDGRLPDAEQLGQLQAATTRLAAARTEREKRGTRPLPVRVGDPFVDKFRTGGKAIFWTDGVQPTGDVVLEEIERKELGDTVQVVQRYRGKLEGRGRFNLDFLLYQAVGVDLTGMDNATLETLRLPPRVITPLAVMILLSLITPGNRKQALDRYYAKMKTPVDPDPEQDRKALESAYADPSSLEHRRLCPWWGLEIQKPTWKDIVGFLVCVGVCFVFVALAVWVANIGSTASG
jgi:SSS family solute:Na+ symporter